MLQIIYVSSAVKPFGRDELLELLNKARVKNSRLGITGLLLYKEGNFMQVLEGEETAVRELFDVISRDPRHYDTIVMLEERIDERLFSDWSMGFRNLTDPEVLATPGFNQFLNISLTPESFAESPSVCMDLLNLFRLQR